jgi:IS605 OrfB family transposase
MPETAQQSDKKVGRRSRYREQRTLVRALHCRRGQNRVSFKEDVRRLRRHFVQFNEDVSGVCQWLIKLRPGAQPESDDARAFWEFFLEPERFLAPEARDRADRCRREVFDAVVLGDPAGETLEGLAREVEIFRRAAAQRGCSPAHERLFSRLREYAPAHRQVLLKAAADWVEARYVRGYENWVRHREEWEKEKTEWEKAHPELTPEIRDTYSQIFSELQIKEKRPRVCPWEHLKKNLDNCLYAGEGQKQRHSPLCHRYQEFLRTSEQKIRDTVKKHFAKNVEVFLTNGMNQLHPGARKWFPKAWRHYRKVTGLSEETLRKKYQGKLPHCLSLKDEKGRERECLFNPHTEKCKEYKRRVAQLPAEQQKLEQTYREWRGLYLAGPRKPSFGYPSARSNSIPKIFGRDYFSVDFQKSEVGLRLDDMGRGEFLYFGFKPWPADYSPQPEDCEITSVQVHFVGTRPRVGFRFTVSHKPSRFACTQDELDELRSRRFPRAAQDQQFLDAARKKLLDSFHDSGGGRIRMLTVDLGTSGAGAAFFEGREFREAIPLKVVKIDQLYDAATAPAERNRKRGLTAEHLGRHLERMREGAAKIAEERKESGPGRLRGHDLRRLVLHSGWMIRDWARTNAAQIIRLAEEKRADLIVFESLRGFRAPGYDKLEAEKKRRFAFFAFGKIRRKVVEKAVERGMRVVTVPYFKSSQVCCKCGAVQENLNRLRKNKDKRRFECEKQGCGFQADSDQNAARVLGRVFWGEIHLPRA